MSTIRQYVAADYDTLAKWWVGHKAVVMPKHVIPQGWVIVSGPVEVAMAFLMLDVGGTHAVVEYLTTNPAVAYSRSLRDDVRQLIAHIEDRARAQGCGWIMSFVAPNTGEERLMKQIGYETSEGPSHRIYAKSLAPKEATCPQ